MLGFEAFMVTVEWSLRW